MSFSKDLVIYYGSLAGEDYIECNCSRWDQSDYNIIIETWLTKADLNTLRKKLNRGCRIYQCRK